MLHLSVKDFFLDSDCAVTTEPRAPQDEFPEHSHDFNEIIIVTSGKGTHVIDDVPYNLSQNCVAFIDTKDRHLLTHVEGLFLTNILYRKDILHTAPQLADFIPNRESQQRNWIISEHTLQETERLIAQLDKETHNQSRESKLMSQAMFQQLVIMLWRGRLDNCSEQTEFNTIHRLINWIEHHYADELDLEGLAEQFQIPQRSLSRKIKQITGLPPAQYIHQVRINKAIEKILYSQQNITDIAFQVGYSDSNYFSTKFKQITGKSPSAFRRRLD